MKPISRSGCYLSSYECDRFVESMLLRSKLDVLDAGHFTWEDVADEDAALVTWWSGGYPTTGSAAAR